MFEKLEGQGRAYRDKGARQEDETEYTDCFHGSTVGLCDETVMTCHEVECLASEIRIRVLIRTSRVSLPS